MNGFTRRSMLRCTALIGLAGAAVPALAQVQPNASATSLFKIVTVKDEIVIGLSANELSELGGQDAGAVAHALIAKTTLTVWQYAVRQAPNGDREQAPLRKIAIMAHDSLRIEPFSTPLKIVPHG